MVHKHIRKHTDMDTSTKPLNERTTATATATATLKLSINQQHRTNKCDNSQTGTTLTAHAQSPHLWKSKHVG